jgi:UDP-N-acetylglucosamine 2-epimerase (non-hydrolysing)
VGSGSQAFQIGEMLKRLERIFLENRYDLVIVYGDTNSNFAGALAANRCGLKTAHVESGLRSYDRRMPEEINRILTDNICDYLFAPTRTAYQNLKKEHVFGRIFDTGDVSVEVIKQAKQLSQKSSILEQLKIEPKSYLLCTMHRAENTSSEEDLIAIIRAFEMLADFDIVFPIHPRTRKALQERNLLGRLEHCHNVRLIDPTGYLDFIRLLGNAKKVITDSGGVQKEAYLLRVPCITIRRSTEWVETVKAGWNIITDTNTRKIVKACRNWEPNKSFRPIFGNGKTSHKIKQIISSLSTRLMNMQSVGN